MDPRNTISLAGQKALVTGANSGIGAAIARALASAGAAVGVNHRGKQEAADKIVREIRDHGGEATALKADVSREDEILKMFDDFIDAFGRIDIVVANAGIQKDAPVTTMTIDDWRAVIEVNLTGQFLCAREAIRRFLAQGESPVSKAHGKIICMSSVHQLIPWAGHVNYAASKGGIQQMMRTLAQEVAEHKIRVNAIAPGAIKTEINREEWEDPEARLKLLKLIPYGRLGETDDVAKAAIWLASDTSDYVTGTTLFVDGAMSLYPAFRDNG
ncbi:MAG: glucose 1-dehydrogenase [Gammaproteobacteria bacterium]|nr:glucose 1-dehydrogenase [Gammaproteobacteria bacterium]